MNPFDIFLPFLNIMEQLFVLLDRGVGNFGLTILIFTAAIRLLLYPLSVPSLKAAKKMQELKPHLDALKEKHKGDKQKMAQAQMDLYKQHGVNPAAGCLPQVLQIFILISLYQVFMKAASGTLNGDAFNISFLWRNLAKADPCYIFSVVAGVSQFILSLMMQPVGQPLVKKEEKDKNKEQDFQSTMNQQMLFMFPLMTVVIAWKFPSGLALYWVATTVFSAIQQYKVSGTRKLGEYLIKLKTWQTK